MKKVIEVLYSDVSGAEIPRGEGESVEFSYRGRAYSIDLTTAEAADFDDVMARYVGNASRVGGSRQSAMYAGSNSGRRPPEQTKAIREWARNHGWPDLGDRGRIPADAEEAFHASS